MSFSIPIGRFQVNAVICCNSKQWPTVVYRVKDMQECFDTRKESKAKVIVSNVFLSVSKHFLVSKLIRP